jgi:hypothetical protein
MEPANSLDDVAGGEVVAESYGEHTKTRPHWAGD